MSRPRAIAWAAAAMALLAAPVLFAIAPESDYAVHGREAVRWLETGRTDIPLPAPLFAGLTALLVAATPLSSPLAAGLLIGVLAHGLLAGIAAAALHRHGDRRAGPVVGLALCLCLAAPIFLPSLASRDLYFGYVGLAVYHNPSVALLRPLALLLLLVLLRPREARQPIPAGVLAGTAALAAAGALAKPSYAIALLPALVWTALRGQQPPDRRLLPWVALPCAAILALQYLYTYSSGQAAHSAGAPSAIALAPLAVVRAQSGVGPGTLALRLLLSAAFPLAVAASFRATARRDPGLRLAWLTFAAAALYAYGLAESGPRAGHGNFQWSAQVALFLLFVVSARHALEQWGSAARGRRRLCGAVLALHGVCGLFWYGVHLLPLVAPGTPPLREWF